MDRNLEPVVEEAGSFGCFQYLMIPLNFSSYIVAVWSMVFMAFGAVEPDWWCESRGLEGNQSAHSHWNFSHGRASVVDDNATVIFPVETNGREYMDMNDTGGVEAKACDVIARSDGACESIVFSPGMSTIVTNFQLVCDMSWVPSLTISLQMVGVLIGAILAGQLADSVGRKKTIVSFTALHAVFNLIAAFSLTWQMFAVMRTLIGLTNGAVLVVAELYPVEFIGKTKRALISSVPFWGLGTTTLSLLVWAVPDWSHVHLIIAACSAVCLPGWLFLPESVRWLTVKGHVTKAQRVLCKMARWNGRNPSDLSSVQTLCSDSGHLPQRKYSYLHIFSTWRMMKISFLLGFMWFCCSITYFGMVFGIKNLSGDFNLNFFLMTVVDLPSPLLVYHLSGWFGRRWALFGSFMVCTLSMATVVTLLLLLSEEEAGNYVNALCFVGRAALELAWNLMSLVTAELYPTVVRSIGTGYCEMSARLGGILAPYILSAKKTYVMYVFTGVAMALTSLVPLLLTETRDQPLPDELIIPSNQKTAATDVDRSINELEMADVNDERIS
ncbi:organic cation/carnitine transporter 2-like [Babylonia areolata]|uniref:organic cation/carnitine transporter 2-like n=1 Tax=Babylonia areolata TaxID=304850 RepID=UPI003FD10E6F